MLRRFGFASVFTKTFLQNRVGLEAALQKRKKNAD
jgi:hypothetical protein